MQPTFETSPDTVKIARHLAELPQSGSATYSALNSLVPGRDLQKKDRHILDSARRMVLRENKIVIECVHKIGVMRITDSEMTMLPAFTLGKIRRASKRSITKTICANYDALSSGEKVKFNSGLSLLGAVALFTSNAKQRQVEGSVAETGDKLSFTKTLSLFGK